MRTCSKGTRNKLMRMAAPSLSAGWVRTAYWDAIHEHPMSVKREKRLLEELGLTRQPRRFYRPCLSVELGEAIKEIGLDVEEVLRLRVKWEHEWKEAEQQGASVAFEDLSQEFGL